MSSTQVHQGKRSTGGGAGGGYGARLDAATAELADLVAGLEPGCLTGPDAKALYGSFVRAERFCVAGKTLLAPRIEETSVWKEEGHASAASMLAGLEGVPVGQARSTLELGHNLDQLPDTTEAIRQGKLSRSKATELVGAAVLDPESEGELLAGADELPHHEVRERCRRSRATSAHHDPLSAVKRIYAERHFQSWSEPDGAFCYSGRDTADRGAQILNHINSVANGLRRQRRAEHKAAEHKAAEHKAKAGGAKAESPETVDSQPALLADAFYALVTRTGGADKTGGAGKGQPAIAGRAGGKARAGGKDRAAATATRPNGDPDVDPDTGDGDIPDSDTEDTEDIDDGLSLIDRPPTCSVNVRVDLAALLRGETLPGELCEIDGQGPIPAKMARDMANDSFLRFVFCESGDIRSIYHFGRTINKALRTALVHRDRNCVVPGCAVSSRLEIDHVQPVTQWGPTTLDNLALLCHHHHFLKTFEGWTLEMVDGRDPGNPTWRFEPLPPFGQEPAPDPNAPPPSQKWARPRDRGDPDGDRRSSGRGRGRKPDPGQLFEPE
jgi:hypothetical protein